MGIWESISSATEAVKRNAPDTTPLKEACRNSYTYGSAAFNRIDQAVRIDGRDKLGQWMPDDETKSKIGLYANKLAKNAGDYALQEGFKFIPGGVAISDILSKTLDDVKYENHKVEKLNVSKDEIGNIPVGSTTDKKPEDVIRVFMMKEIFCTRFFDDLMVHELARGKGKKPE